MITAAQYFEKYLSWQNRQSSLRSASLIYMPYQTLELTDLRPEAEAGNPSALLELGERYLFGLSDLAQDVDRAQALIRQAAEAGHPDAMHMMADIHRTAEFGRQDYDLYFPRLKQAAEAGCWKAMFNLSCACYKGKDAYEGHGFATDRMSALYWGTQCAIMTMGLLEFYFTHECGDGFQDYMQGVYALFVQSVCTVSRQLIRGDGVPRDPAQARSMLQNAQSFYRHFFRAGCSDFEALMKRCDAEA